MLRRKIHILTTGIALPEKLLTHNELDGILGLRAGESLDITGVSQRYQATHETAADLASRACETVIRESGMSWNEIDVLVSASATMDKALPYNAAMIHARLGLEKNRTTTFDVGSSCMSFLTGLDLAGTLIDSGRYHNMILVSCDISSYTVDYTNLRENGIFGDGAAAVFLNKSEEGESEIIASRSITLSEGVDYCHINAGGSRYHRRVPDSAGNEFFGMNGRQLLSLAERELPGFLKVLLAEAGMRMDDIDLVIPHQASKLSLDRLARKLRLSRDRYIDIFSEYGNQVSASLPTALHHAIIENRLKRGDTALLIGSGAGVTLGGMILKY